MILGLAESSGEAVELNRDALPGFRCRAGHIFCSESGLGIAVAVTVTVTRFVATG